MLFTQEGKTVAMIALEGGTHGDGYICFLLLVGARVDVEGVDLHLKSDVSIFFASVSSSFLLFLPLSFITWFFMDWIRASKMAARFCKSLIFFPNIVRMTQRLSCMRVNMASRMPSRFCWLPVSILIRQTRFESVHHIDPFQIFKYLSVHKFFILNEK